MQGILIIIKALIAHIQGASEINRKDLIMYDIS